MEAYKSSWKDLEGCKSSWKVLEAFRQFLNIIHSCKINTNKHSNKILGNANQFQYWWKRTKLLVW